MTASDIQHILQFFEAGHLPKPLRKMSEAFGDLARKVSKETHNPETVVALRKLLEAKDAAVRAVLCPNETEP